MHIEKSKETPSIKYDAKTKTLEISGRSYPEDTINFYKPLFDWIDELNKKTIGMLNISFRLDYLNTSSTKALIHALWKLEKICKVQGNLIVVNWYYCQMDEEIMETGQVFSSILSLPVNIIEVAA